ncbi:TetR/AcrR family transcriptional regulator [Verticiella sediminum]|uniref:TetR/AcrR family transcriptional regulator n=1 Tax=Verticiella sediminum TaxID=1247510 RepID=A0A556AVH2_9BURK|nr:TetR/AcrR family transcriptional regulator [Verticiella sediminum]TSH96927.1 TetR/AcrR family transcriptional regulator [Verticiella sediminum]
MARRGRDSEGSIEKIENAALRLFSKQGYSNTSLEQVADVAGFTKGAVYYYFKTKETLLIHLLSRIQERSILKTAEHVRGLPGGTVDKLVAFVKLQTQWAARYPDDIVILLLTSLEFSDTDTPVRDMIHRYYDVMRSMLVELFEAGRSAGDVPAELDIDSAVLTNIARHDGNMLLWHRSGRDPDVGRVLTAAALDAVRRYGIGGGDGAIPVPRRKN